MSRGKRLEIELKPRDRQQVEKLLGGGLQAVRTTLRALALRQMDQGLSTPAVGANLGLSAYAFLELVSGKVFQKLRENGLASVHSSLSEPAVRQEVYLIARVK